VVEQRLRINDHLGPVFGNVILIYRVGVSVVEPALQVLKLGRQLSRCGGRKDGSVDRQGGAHGAPCLFLSRKHRIKMFA
jgi:hypothetical protein